MTTIAHRRGTAARWSTVNPVLSAGELGVEIDTLQVKVGDGLTDWNNLVYIGQITSYPQFDVRRYGTTGTSDDSATIQAAIDAAEAAGGGEVILQRTHTIASGLTIDSSGVTIRFAGGSARGTTVAAGGRLIYTGGNSAPAIYINGGSGGIQGVGLANFRLENQGTGSVGVHIFNVSNCEFSGVHVREFSADHWILECDTNVSSIYNSFRQISGFKTGNTAIGFRMLEGVGKAVNNNLVEQSNFGNNLVGIQQDTDCHDNVFSVTELGNCTTGAKIRGRTTFEAANIENCTTGIDIPTGSAATISGSIHFASNTADVNNPDERPIWASMHGGGSSNSMSINPRNTAMSFRGQTLPSTGGIALSTADGDPSINRTTVQHLVFASGKVQAAVKLETLSDLVASGSSGTAGDVLTSNGAGSAPGWSAPSSGGVSDGDKGDITVSGSGATWTVDNDAVTFAKMQNIATDRLIGRDTASSGDPEELTVGGGLEFTGSGGIQRSALTGEVTASAGSNTTTIADGVTVATWTLNSPTFGAGSASANSWPKFTSGTILTTAEAGAIELDSNCFYMCTDAGNRGVVSVEHWIRASSAQTLTNTGSAQNIFDSPANGTLTLETGVYYFRGMVLITGMSGTSGNATFLFGGTGTFGGWLWRYTGLDNTTTTTIGADVGAWRVNNTSAANLVTAGTGTALRIEWEGTFECTVAGTWIPQITLTTGAAATVAEGSFLHVKRVGATSMDSVGQWS